MELYMDKERLQTLFNCSQYKIDDIPQEMRVHTVAGSALLIMFFTFEIIYLPCIWAFMKKENCRESCYKLMLMLGFLDVINMVVSGFLTGYFAITGAVYCTHPTFIYFAGTFGLALNRCIEMWNPHFASQLFHGSRVYYWMLLPVLYMLYFIIFTQPPVYSSILVGWFFNPHIGYLEDKAGVYHNSLHAFHNIFIALSLTIIYVLFFIRFKRTVKSLNERGVVRKRQYNTFIQVLLIGVSHICCTAVYTYMQYFIPSVEMVLFASFTWLLAQGITPLIYITMNAKLRRSLTQCKRKSFVSTHAVTATNRVNTMYTSKVSDNLSST